MDGQDTNGALSAMRSLPQVDRLSNALPPSNPPWVRVEGARAAISRVADAIRSGSSAPAFEELVRLAQAEIEARSRVRLGPVINATGVLLHTNLGRAPLSAAALEAVQRTAAGYCNLEYDLAGGARGSRYSQCARMLAEITGAQAALVVNNNAAAVLLALRALAAGKQAVISRGELIEIGGEFRIPQIMQESGAVLREVGTTNRTHLRDFQQAIGPDTGVILKVHPSNYEVTGFTASVSGKDLAQLAHSNGLGFIHDVGSGLISRQIAGGSVPAWLAKEPSVTQAVADGADLVTFSGDKLLGGPQAGLIVGTEHSVAQVKASPLLRTLRTDKTTLAALDATLEAYRAGEQAGLPLWRMALTGRDELLARSRALVEAVASGASSVAVADGFSTTGGGSAPSSMIPTPVIRIIPSAAGARVLAEQLRAARPPVIARIEDGALELNLRTVDPADDRLLARLLARLPI